MIWRVGGQNIPPVRTNYLRSPQSLTRKSLNDSDPKDDASVMHNAFQAGDYERSLKISEKFTLKASHFFEYHRIRILSLSRMHRHDEAMDAARAVIDRFPGGEPAAFALAVSTAIASRDFKACLDSLLRLVLAGGTLNCGLLNSVLKNATIQSDRNNLTPEEVQANLECQIRILRSICDATGRRPMLLIGNCQVPVLAEILNNTPAYSKNWFAYCYKGVHACSSAELLTLGSLVDSFDYLVTQNIFSDAFGSLRTEVIRSSYTGMLITIPTCWFNITSLDAFRLSQMRNADPDSNMHSVFLARAFLDGISADQAVSRYDEAALFTDKVLSGSMQLTAANLRQRDRGLDFSITDYVLGEFVKKRLFYSYNHPGLAVLLEVCAGIAKRIDLFFQKDLKRYAAFDRLINPLWCTHPRIRRYFGLCYTEDSVFKFNDQRMDISVFAEREYELFARQDNRSLCKDVEVKEEELKYGYSA